MTARTRLLSALIVVAAVVVGGVTLAQSRGSGHSKGSPVVPSPPASSSASRNHGVAAALAQRLQQRGLSYRWVVCVPMARHYAGSRLYRCNVNFGSPHIVPYCAALVDGRLRTDHENRRLDCGARVKADERDQSVYAR